MRGNSKQRKSNQQLKTATTIIPRTTPNAIRARLWKRERVWVTLLNDNETAEHVNKDLFEESLKPNKKKMFRLSLTPPIVVAWFYKLARALSEGNYKP